MMSVESESSKSVLQRMDLVMSAVQQQRRQTLTQVCARTGLPRTTVHRFLDHLVEMRWLSRVGNQYELGIRMLEMGAGTPEEHWFHRLAHPELIELHLRTRLTVHLTFLDGPDIVFWNKLAGRDGALIPSRIGGRHPAHLSAAGKAILAAAEPRVLAEFCRAPLAGATERSITTIDHLVTEISRVRSTGIARDNGEAVDHVGCLGAAVVAKEGGATTAGTPMIAAVSVAGPRDHMLGSRSLESALRATCHSIQQAAALESHRAYAG